jgi:hypothetical protein
MSMGPASVAVSAQRSGFGTTSAVSHPATTAHGASLGPKRRILRLDQARDVPAGTYVSIDFYFSSIGNRVCVEAEILRL